MLPVLVPLRRTRTLSAATPPAPRDAAREPSPPGPSARAGSARRAESAPRAAPYRVVLVDDAENFRMLVRIILSRDGRFQVVGEAGDGERGVEVARETQPDLVLLDLTMPVMDGLEALPLLRKAAPSSRILVLSGLERARMEPEVRALGAAGYVEKGGRPEALLRDVLAALED